MDMGYDDAQPSTSAPPKLNISPRFTKIKKRGKKKTSMNEVVKGTPLEVVDVQKIIEQVHNSEQLYEVNHPEVVEEVEELVEYIDVKQEPVDESEMGNEAEEVEKEAEEEKDISTVQDLRQFSYATPIKIEPIDSDHE